MDEIKQLLIDIFSEKTSQAYKARREHLKQLFASYNSIAECETKVLLQSIVESDKAYCIKMCNEQMMIEHNTFVLRYLSEKQPTVAEIAQNQNCVTRTAFNYINAALDRMMIFAYGIDGLKI